MQNPTTRLEDLLRETPKARKMRERMEYRNVYGVDAPLTRAALAIIYLHTGALPKGFSEEWKNRLGLADKVQP